MDERLPLNDADTAPLASLAIPTRLGFISRNVAAATWKVDALCFVNNALDPLSYLTLSLTGARLLLGSSGDVSLVPQCFKWEISMDMKHDQIFRKFRLSNNVLPLVLIYASLRRFWLLEFSSSL